MFFFYCSYLGTTLRQANIEPMPSISDVRRVITEFAILPLGKYRIGRQLRFSLEKNYNTTGLPQIRKKNVFEVRENSGCSCLKAG